MPRNYDLTGRSPTAQQRLPEHTRDDQWTREFLRRAEIGYVGTRWEDQPFVTPTNFWFDEQNRRIIFHSNLSGRLRANLDRHPKVCFVASEVGRILPSNVALEFSVQYRSVMVFGTVSVLQDPQEARQALVGLIGKYFPGMKPGAEYRPITDKELQRTAVYALQIESWSGKENWKERAEQSAEWPALGEKWILD
jgi:nitroimidazol reductase NimA-like FMN-containing flavoprotein (pyridoxamine 5'-phosphate oxidase superfamily)